MIRRLVLRGLTLHAAARAWAPFTHSRLCVFMLHRFHDPERGSQGHDPAKLAGLLERLREERYELVDLEEGLARLGGEGPPLYRAVAFTLDDGYDDQVEIGLPLFGAYDCPATVFAVSGFQDGDCWMWWDQVEFILDRAHPGWLDLPLDGRTVRVAVGPDACAARGRATLVEALKRCPDAERRRALADLAGRCDVPLPDAAPARYAPAGWDRLRRAEAAGMRVGPHSVSHPVLARLDDGGARREIELSHRRLTEELERPVPVFCYPNGQADDYGDREIGILREAGLAGAVTTEPGYAALPPDGSREDAPYRLGRFDLPEDPAWALQYASGLEQLKSVLLRR